MVISKIVNIGLEWFGVTGEATLRAALQYMYLGQGYQINSIVRLRSDYWKGETHHQRHRPSGTWVAESAVGLPRLLM